MRTPWEERPLFARDADVTVYWPDVRPEYDNEQDDTWRPEDVDDCPGAGVCEGHCDQHQCIDGCCGGGCEACLSMCPGWHE